MPGRRPRISVVDHVPPKQPGRPRARTVPSLADEVRTHLDGQPNGRAVRLVGQPYGVRNALKRALGDGFNVESRNLRHEKDGSKRYMCDVYVTRAASGAG